MEKVTRVETVTVRIREMILKGELAAGTRVPERDLAQRLGVSRTPVRVALGILQAEGLVRGEPNCGFVVNALSHEDILSAFDVRGVLEGFAARTAVERGLRPDLVERLRAAVAEGEVLVARGTCDAEGMRRWSLANDVFHGAIIEAAGLSALGKVHEFTSRMPLVAPVAILFTNDRHDDAYARMADAHRDHIQVLQALLRGEGERADYLMREHAYRSRERLSELFNRGFGGDASDEVMRPMKRARPA